MKNFFLPLALLAYAVQSKQPTFGPRDTIHWQVDLQNAYPLGVFCSELRVEGVNQHHRQLWTITRVPDNDPLNYASNNYFVGNRYMVVVPARIAGFTAGERAHLRLVCMTEEESQIELAESKIFQVVEDGNQERDEVKVLDVSLLFLEDQPLQCPNYRVPVWMDEEIHEAADLITKIKNGEEPCDDIYCVNRNILKERQSMGGNVDLQEVVRRNLNVLEMTNLYSEIITESDAFHPKIWSAKKVQKEIEEANNLVYRGERNLVLSENAASLASRVGESFVHGILMALGAHPLNLLRLLDSHQGFNQMHSFLSRNYPFLRNAESDKDLSAKLMEVVRLSICLSLPAWAAIELLKYHWQMRGRKWRINQWQAHEKRKILDQSLEPLREKVRNKQGILSRFFGRGN